MDAIKGGTKLKPKGERKVSERHADARAPANPEADENARKLATALATRRGAIGDGKDDGEDNWDFGRTRVRKRPEPKASKARPYL